MKLCVPALLIFTVAAMGQQPRPPLETVKAFTLPEGFSATLFAGEPDLVQPIGFCFDHRGRLWVAENHTYPKWSPEGNDRILIFEDVDGDGRFDKRSVFYDKLNYLTGLEVGFGGVWVVSAPHLLFIPDKDADDKPDGPPQVMLEGFGHEGVHNLVNGCVWGPDGWLWGGHGGTSSGRIGTPQTKEQDRIFFDGGVWRFHPTKNIFEPVMEGTTNPWGLDFDDYGQAFISNSVTPHLYHVIMGAHVERRRVSPNSRYAYGVIDTIADHKHYVGGDWTKSRTGAENLALGGGHSHCGLMVYLGDNWPDKYRGTIFMNNIHGDRMNNDLPQRKGSGYVARHGDNLITCGDPWYMALHVKCGPEGAVYVSDWYDTGECHTRKPKVENGRIYRIAYGQLPKRPLLDLASATSSQLIDLQASRNEWLVRHARRVLQARGPDERVHVALLALLKQERDVSRRLRLLWALHATGGASEELLLGLLKDPSEYVRGWAVTFLGENRAPSDTAHAELLRLAREDESAWVRLQLASLETRLPVERRWDLLGALVARGDDVQDQNLPFMYWYALEPMAMADPKRALALAMNSKYPKLRENIARRLAERK